MREESFSSQNVNLFITAISERGSMGTGFTVGLSEGSSFFISLKFLENYNLAKNDEVSEELFEALENESDYIKALIKGADLISRGEESSGRLLLKLQKKGFKSQSARRVVERLKEEKLIDDLRFSELWLSSRLRRHPEGTRALLAGLLKRGVPSEAAGEALSLYVGDEELATALELAVHKLSRRFSSEPEKLKQTLRRRGFTHYAIENYFQSYDN